MAIKEPDSVADAYGVFAHIESLRRRKISSRKFRLFACACCRRVWHLIGDARSRRAVEVAERFADGRASRKELVAARAACPGRGDGAAANFAAKAAVCTTASSARDAVLGATTAALNAAKQDGIPNSLEDRQQVQLLQEIVGNPFRRPVINPDWLTWNDGTVAKLARAIDDDGRFADLPILGDALLDAGCTDSDLLTHCRNPDGHVRGCWLLDVILGKG